MSPDFGARRCFPLGCVLIIAGCSSGVLAWDQDEDVGLSAQSVQLIHRKIHSVVLRIPNEYHHKLVNELTSNQASSNYDLDQPSKIGKSLVNAMKIPR